MEFINNDLHLDIDNIVFMQECIETDLTKMWVEKTKDFNLDYPYIIDIEDKSFFYPNIEERDLDYDVLVKILNTTSKKHFYI